MAEKKVMITGMGAVSAAGKDLGETLDSIGKGIRNAGRVTLFETSLGYPVFEAGGVAPKSHPEGTRTLFLALSAVKEALRDAGLEGGLSGMKAGVSLGTTVASQLNDIGFYSSYRKTGSAPAGPVDRYLKGNLAEFISREFGASGPSLTVVNACSSGTDAIGAALSWIRCGLCEIAVAGGSDELNLIPLSGFGSLGIVSMEMCAPFDKDRKGLNLGEGAGVLVIETEESALRRGRRPGLFLSGYGSAADAYHLTSPRPDGAGLRASIRRALKEAGIGPGEIGFINAHGTATHENDLVEGKTLADIFGNKAKVLSTKGFTGHTLGAAGGLEAVFTSAGLREGWIPKSAGFREKDDLVALEPVRERTVIECRYALSTSLAFGGNNSALVIGRGP